MKVLFLAPQPFYQERGTPIAVKLALEALAHRTRERYGDHARVDVLTYAEGESVQMEGVRILRIPRLPFLRGVRPGVSLKKIVCDALLTLKALRLLWNSRAAQYSVVHAVEESVFIALLAKRLFGVPYVYDMDSSLALQVTEKWWLTKPLLPVFKCLESMAIKHSVAVAPVCDALEEIALENGSKRVVLLRDVSLLEPSELSAARRTALREELGAQSDAPLVLYVGNLEPYQGIDLLLESFARVAAHPNQPRLAIIGGPNFVEQYRKKAHELGCCEQVKFAGPRPVGRLGEYLACADILVSPRTRGNNTPMKIYSYLHSGKALVATDLPTHRQVLDDSVACLAAPSAEQFGSALERLIESPELRAQTGERARVTATRLYTREAFGQQLDVLYTHVEEALVELGNRTPAPEKIHGTSL